MLFVRFIFIKILLFLFIIYENIIILIYYLLKDYHLIYSYSNTVIS